PCVHGLVALSILRAILATDVRGQRDVPVFLKSSPDVRGAFESDPSLDAAGRLQYDNDKVVRDPYPSSLPQPPPPTEECIPLPVPVVADEQDLGRSASFPAAEEPGREHAAAVCHQEIAGIEELGQVPERLVTDRSRPLVEHEQPRGIPLGE